MERSPLFTINTILVENIWGTIIWWIINPWKPKNTPYVFHLLHCAHRNKRPRPCVMLMHLLSTNLTFFMVQEQLHEFLSTLLHSSHWLVDIIDSKCNVCTFLNAIICWSTCKWLFLQSWFTKDSWFCKLHKQRKWITNMDIQQIKIFLQE